MTNRLEMNRRQFVVTTAAVGGGMVVGFQLPTLSGKAFAAGEPEINAWIVIAPDDTITIRVKMVDTGNATSTGYAQLVCEELGCNWEKVKVEFPDLTRHYSENKLYGIMVNTFARVQRYREEAQKAGAIAREKLIAAAAQQWNVPGTEIEAKNSILTHKPTGRNVRYGEVAAKAGAVKLAQEPKIKTPEQFTFAGKVSV